MKRSAIRRTPFKPRKDDKANRPPLRAVSPKPAKCAVCEEKYVRERSGQKVCGSFACLKEWVERKRVEKATAAYRPERGGLTKAARESRKDDKAHQIKLTQKAHNEWIRERDHGLPCISCGIQYGKREAGHFRSVGAAPELRFCSINTHVQCSQCNSTSMKSGNIVEYRKGLVSRIGEKAVQWIEGPHEAAKWTCDELAQVRAAYRAATRRLAEKREK